MNWHYKIIKEIENGEKYYALVEYYPGLRKILSEDPEVNLHIADDAPDTDDAWTEPLLVGESKADIISQLKQMLRDVE